MITRRREQRDTPHAVSVHLKFLVIVVAATIRAHVMLFDDEDCEGAEAVRTSIVAPAQVSETAQAKARSKRTADGGPVHSLRTLLNDLATCCWRPTTWPWATLPSAR